MTRATSSRPPIWLAFWGLIPAALVLLPVGYVADRSWQAGWHEIVDEVFRARTFDLLVNTLTLAFSVTLGCVVLGLGAAWCTERCDLPWRHGWRRVAGLPLAVPAFVASYAWSSLGQVFEGMFGAILVLTVACLPLIYLPAAAALRGMDPSFEDVARTLGIGPWRSFWRITLPQALPALGGGALLVMSHMFAEFGALAFLRVNTFTTAIFDQYELQFDNASAAMLSGILILLCLPIVWAEMLLRDNLRLARTGPGSARRLPVRRLGWARWPIFLLFVAVSIVAFGVPLVTLLSWLLRGASAGMGVDTLLPAALGSLSLAVPGALLTTVLAVPLVLMSTRYRGWLPAFADRLPYVVHGLPGIVVALALVYLAIHYCGFIYQTTPLVLIAYVILFLPQAQSAVKASVALVPRELEYVARSLGRKPVAAFFAVTLPNIMPGIGSALSLVVLQLMRELTATLLLAPTGVVTLATEFWSYTNDRAYAAAAPFAVVLVLVSGLPVYFFTLKFSQVRDR
ncbi:ABC transporter permease [Methylovirgula sp. 4M-Z18]|uniref:ABC transporter permease n=1 Tax=Methylovirgula sp. 4M-Z18 TaxID=2293567 RepID=UPI000E2EF0C2|nr:iron ABC transporter permease [Methylovirgula sp. 4M-Z18]RFB81071.1 iron ABC transporter permease [Methylovirgula sp. 4M-Z18]